jgi:hypothetical protein
MVRRLARSVIGLVRGENLVIKVNWGAADGRAGGHG